MAYAIPQFPLTINIWRAGNPTINPPDVVTFGNLSPGKRSFASALTVPPLAGPQILMELLVPKLTDIRGWNATTSDDTVECPAGSGRFYDVVFVDDIGKGFTNEHRFALMIQKTPWPTPLP